MNINSKRFFLIFLLALYLGSSACSFKITRYSDGALTEYVKQPLPELDKPIARTVSVEKIMYYTSGGMKGILISDLLGREVYILPGSVGKEINGQLKMDEEFSEEATLAALNTVSRRKAEARHMWKLRKLGKEGLAKLQSAPPVEESNKTIIATKQGPSTASTAYINNQNSLAAAASKKGDYLGSQIHHGAALNRMQIDHAFARAQNVLNLGFSAVGGMMIEGEKMEKRNFYNLRNWLEHSSGAINESAPEGSHLTVFFFRFFDAKMFQYDSRMRSAVYLVLTDKNGVSTAVLEGSDILVCKDECNLFQPKPTAKVFEKTEQTEEIQKLLWTKEGVDILAPKGFTNPFGLYHYLLLKHGLKKLATKAAKS